jgi:hypothetical protein
MNDIPWPMELDGSRGLKSFDGQKADPGLVAAVLDDLVDLGIIAKWSRRVVLSCAHVLDVNARAFLLGAFSDGTNLDWLGSKIWGAIEGHLRFASQAGSGSARTK